MAKPKIRFKGYTEEWEERKLGDVVDYNNGIGHEEYVLPEGKYELVTLKSINSEGKMTCSEKFVNKEFETLQKGTLIMMLSEQAKGMLGMTAIIPCNNKYILNQRVAALTLRDGIDSSFLTKAINRKQYYFEQMGAGTKVQNITKGHVENCIIEIPKYEEQLLIGNYFSSLDHLITLHQQKCEETKTLKKYMLQKMFVQNGQTVPQIRFKGFTEDWEERKLGDFGKATGGTSIESEFSEDGIYKVISIGSYSENSIYNDQGIRAIKSDKTSNRVLNRNDLTMILNDKTTSGNIIGRVLLIEESGIYVYNQRAERIEINLDEYDPVFLYEMLNAPNIREKIIKQAQGNTQIYVNWTAISLLEYMIPSKEEQAKIGEYLHSISNLITLHQQKCDTLKNIKKYMLQNMFV